METASSVQAGMCSLFFFLTMAVTCSCFKDIIWYTFLDFTKLPWNYMKTQNYYHKKTYSLTCRRGNILDPSIGSLQFHLSPSVCCSRIVSFIFVTQISLLQMWLHYLSPEVQSPGDWPHFPPLSNSHRNTANKRTFPVSLHTSET